MEINDFIKNFGQQFDETDISEFNATTCFRELDEWSSLNGLAIMNMIAKKYAVKLSPEEMKSASTIQQLFDIVTSKK